MRKSIIYTVRCMALLMVLLLSACSASSDIAGGGGDDGLQWISLRLSLSTGTETKSRATNISSEATDIAINESKINNIIVGVFSSDGTELRTIQELTDSLRTFTVAAKNGDIVLVAVNVPRDKYTSVTTANGFKSVSLSAEEALGVTDGAETNSSILMYGETTIPDVTNSSLSVTVSRLISKIVIKNISVNFDANGPYKNATFTPTEVFMYNVPDSITAYSSSPYKTGPTYLHGESTNTTNQAVYLGTGALTASAISGTAGTYACNKVLYTTPNNNTTTKTRLVVKGTFTSGSSEAGTAAGTYYYPIVFDNIAPNTAYTIESITIKGFGVTAPGDNFTNKDATVNVSTGFEDSGTTTSTVNNQGFNATVTVSAFDDVNTTVNFPVQIGDFLYSDGTCGVYDSNKTPIAIVFSNEPSATDKAARFTHGYAMALKNVSGTFEWGNYGDVSKITNVTTTNDLIADKDGLAHSQLIKTYPAVNAAINYQYSSSVTAGTHPKGCSGWYLPSIGQLFDICVNLGGMSTSDYKIDDGSYLYWSGQSSICAANINSKLQKVEHDEFAENNVYWSSSESSDYDAGRVHFYSGYLQVYYGDKRGPYMVRPVIAF